MEGLVGSDQITRVLLMYIFGLQTCGLLVSKQNGHRIFFNYTQPAGFMWLAGCVAVVGWMVCPAEAAVAVLRPAADLEAACSHVLVGLASAM